MPKAIVTGVSGQDGAWLSEYLLSLGYEVYGAIRRTSTRNLYRLEYLGIEKKIKLIEFDLLDYSNIVDVVRSIQPDEFYNLAAQSFVHVSYKQPLSTFQMDGMGVAYILDAIKTFSPHTKFYQASTSEMFGKVRETPQNELTPFHPRSPYGVAKAFAHWNTVNYRESHNLFACCGILFNHESELRGPEFVTKKISQATARRQIVELGNLDAVRDWGYAKEYVRGMHKMLQQDEPDDYVLATGRGATVRQFVEAAYKSRNVNLYWEGTGVDEVGRDAFTTEKLVKVSPEFYRPAEVDLLLGNPTKASKKLGWEATTDMETLAALMVRHDLC